MALTPNSNGLCICLTGGIACIYFSAPTPGSVSRKWRLTLFVRRTAPMAAIQAPFVYDRHVMQKADPEASTPRIHLQQQLRYISVETQELSPAWRRFRRLSPKKRSPIAYKFCKGDYAQKGYRSNLLYVCRLSNCAGSEGAALLFL